MNANHLFLTELISEWILYKEQKLNEAQILKASKSKEQPVLSYKSKLVAWLF
jgi:hypothetical protein